MGFIRRKEPAKRARLARGGARDPFEHLHAEREQFEDEEPWFLAGDDGADIEVQAGVSSNLDAADLLDAAQTGTSPTATGTQPVEGTPRRNDPLDDLFDSTPGPDGVPVEPRTELAQEEVPESGETDAPGLPPLPPASAATGILEDHPGQPAYTDPSGGARDEPAAFEPPPGTPRHLASANAAGETPAQPLFSPEPPGHFLPAEHDEPPGPAGYDEPRHLSAEPAIPQAEDNPPPWEPFVPVGQPGPSDSIDPEVTPEWQETTVGAEPPLSPPTAQQPAVPMNPGPPEFPLVPDDRGHPPADTAPEPGHAQDGPAAHNGEELLSGRLDISHLIEGPPFTGHEADNAPPLSPPPIAPAPQAPQTPLPPQAPQPSEPPSDTFMPSGQLESALVASFRDLVAHQGPPPAAEPTEDEVEADAAAHPSGEQSGPIPELPSDRVEPRRPRRAPRRPPGF